MMPLEGLIKIEDEIKRLEADASKLQKEVDRVTKKLANENFVSKAPEAVVEEERQKGETYQAQLDAVQARIEQLKSLI